MTREWLLWALPYAALLACPVMMLWMMRGGGMGRSEEDRDPSAGGAEASGSPERDAEIAELRSRLARLEAEREDSLDASRRAG